MMRLEAASIEELGSSRTNTVGLPILISLDASQKYRYDVPIRAIARLSFRLLPPDNLAATRLPYASKPTLFMTVAASSLTSVTPLALA